MKKPATAACMHVFLDAAIVRPVFVAIVALAAAYGLLQSASAQPDPLPSWNAGKAKQSIIDFVTRVTKKDGTDYVKLEDRIAVACRLCPNSRQSATSNVGHDDDDGRAR